MKRLKIFYTEFFTRKEYCTFSSKLTILTFNHFFINVGNVATS